MRTAFDGPSKPSTGRLVSWSLLLIQKRSWIQRPPSELVSTNLSLGCRLRAADDPPAALRRRSVVWYAKATLRPVPAFQLCGLWLSGWAPRQQRSARHGTPSPAPDSSIPRVAWGRSCATSAGRLVHVVIGTSRSVLRHFGSTSQPEFPTPISFPISGGQSNE